MLLGFVPAPFLVMFLNHDSSVSALTPILIVCVVSGVYSWRKWQNRPEDTQSIAFMGLDRRTRWSTYQSILQGRRIEDPVVVTMIEAMHQHLRQRIAVVIMAIVAIAAPAIVLIQVGGGGAAWVSMLIAVLCLVASALPFGSSSGASSSSTAARQTLRRKVDETLASNVCAR
jgi:hypothetical protein